MKSTIRRGRGGVSFKSYLKLFLTLSLALVFSMPLALTPLAGALSASAQGGAALDAFDFRTQSASVGPEIDSVSAAQALPGNYTWPINIFNHYEAAVPAPSITVESSLNTQYFPDVASFPVTASGDSIPANSLVQLGRAERSTYPANFTAGFDSSRSIIPLNVPPGPSLQTVTIIVTPRERYNTPYSQLWVSVQDAVIAGTETHSAGIVESASPGERISWRVDGAVAGTVYTFSVQIAVDNPRTEAFPYKPSVQVNMTPHNELVYPEFGQNVDNATTVVRQDDVLGTVTYSVGDLRNWFVALQDNWSLSYQPLQIPAPVNLPPVLTADLPSVTVDEGDIATNNGTFFDPNEGQNVSITASVGTVTKTGISSGSWSWSNPALDGPVTYNVTVIADDGAGGTAQTTFTVNVKDVLPPTPAFSLVPNYPADVDTICTPLVMNTNANGAEYWFVKAKSTNLDITLTAHAVNNLDPETVEARIFDTVTGLQVGTVLSASYPAGTIAGTDVGTTGSYPAVANRVYRIQIRTPNTPSSQSHYKLRFDGALEAAINSPSFASLEPVLPNPDPTKPGNPDAVIWFFNVAPGEELKVSVFGNGTPAPPSGTQSIEVRWQNPVGNPVGLPITLSGNYPIAKEIPQPAGVTTVPGAWRLVVPQADSHYRLKRDGAADNAIYLTPVTYGQGKITGTVTTASGAPFNAPVTINLRRWDGPPAGQVSRSVVTTNGSFTINDVRVGPGRVEVVPPPGAAVIGPSFFDVFVECQETDTVRFILDWLNRPPVAVSDSATTNVFTPVDINVLANDTDADGDLLKVTAVSASPDGTIAIAPDGNSVTYTPSPDFSGEDSFTYTVSDGNGGTATATVTVRVNIVSTGEGKITAGVLRFGNNGRGGFNVQSDGNGLVKGELEYHNGTDNLHAHQMTAVAVSPDGRKGWFAGILDDGRAFKSYVEDNGEPGADDVFKLWVEGVLLNGDGKLTGGNVQIHK